MEKTGVNKEDAKQTLKENDEVADAIMELQ